MKFNNFKLNRNNFLLKSTAILLGIGVTGYGIANRNNQPHSAVLLSSSNKPNINEKNQYVDEPINNQDLTKENLCDHLIKRYQIEHGIPAVIVSVSQNSKTIYSKAFGFADVENNVRATPHTVMRIASISKPLACLLAAKLIENHKLDIDLSIHKYADDLPEFKTKDGSVHDITTRQLMSHTSGIRHYEKTLIPAENTSEEIDQTKASALMNDPSNHVKIDTKQIQKENRGDTAFEEFYLNKKFKTTKEALELFINDTLMYEPGKRYLYSTHGFTLLSYIIEKANGADNDNHIHFSQLLTDLFKTNDLRNTYLDQNEPIIPNRSKYYMRNKQKRLVNTPYIDASYKLAGGGLLSNVIDLTKFGNLMLTWYQTPSRSDLEEENYLKSATIRNYLWSPQSLDEKKTHLLEKLTNNREKIFYGLGWFLCIENHTNQLKYAYHTGGAVGASSCLLIIPKSDKLIYYNGTDIETSVKRNNGLVVAVLCNSQDLSEISKFACDISRIFLDNDQINL